MKKRIQMSAIFLLVTCLSACDLITIPVVGDRLDNILNHAVSDATSQMGNTNETIVGGKVIYFQNNSGMDISRLWVFSNDSGTWGENLLDGNTLSVGNKMPLQLTSNTGLYDFRVEYINNETDLFMAVPTEIGNQFSIDENHVLFILDETGESIDAFSASIPTNSE